MGYITNYSYCTAMVSSSVKFCKLVQIHQLDCLHKTVQNKYKDQYYC